MDTCVRPTCKKGAVRAAIANSLQQEMKNGKLKVIIARAADFISEKNSVLIEMVYKNLIKGKKADWFISTKFWHSFTYTPDAAKGLALLGNTTDAYNQIWHLPTSSEKLTMQQWIELFATALGKEVKTRVMPEWLVGVLGLFIPILKEFKEMLYQYDRDYFFNSEKFQSRFSINPTKAKDAINAIIKDLKVI